MAEGEDGFPWEAHLQRQILRCVLVGTLWQTPAVVEPAYFGGTSPRAAIARAVQAHAAAAPHERPTEAALDVCVARVARTLRTEEERVALAAEWRAVKATEVPNPTFVAAMVREWAKQKLMEAVLGEAIDLLDRARQRDEAVEPAAWQQLMDRPLALVSTDTTSLRPLIDRADLTAVRRFYQHQRHQVRIPTGFRTLDHALKGGVPPGQTFYWMAAGKGGKTSALLSVALGAARRRRTDVLFASYEMSDAVMRDRGLRALSGYTSEELEAAPARAEKAARGTVAAGMGTVWLLELTTRHTVVHVAQALERLRRGGAHIELVVFDYLNRMSGQGPAGREYRHELIKISQSIADFAHEHQVGTWSAALVRREAMNKAIITKDDIAEAIGVIAVLDGAVAICSTPAMREQALRRFYLTCMRHVADERPAGAYQIDFERMRFAEVDEDRYRDLLGPAPAQAKRRGPLAVAEDAAELAGEL